MIRSWGNIGGSCGKDEAVESEVFEGAEGGGSCGEPFALGVPLRGEGLEIGVDGAAGAEEDAVEGEFGEGGVGDRPVVVKDKGVEADAEGGEGGLAFVDGGEVGGGVTVSTGRKAGEFGEGGGTAKARGRRIGTEAVGPQGGGGVWADREEAFAVEGAGIREGEEGVNEDPDGLSGGKEDAVPGGEMGPQGGDAFVGGPGAQLDHREREEGAVAEEGSGVAAGEEGVGDGVGARADEEDGGGAEGGGVDVPKVGNDAFLGFRTEELSGGNGGVVRPAGVEEALADGGDGLDAHVDGEVSVGGGEGGGVVVGEAEVSAEEGDGASGVAVGEAGAGACGAELCGGNGGNDLGAEVPGAAEVEGFAEPPQNAGVAAVEADDEFAGLGLVEDAAVDVGLGGGVGVSFFADVFGAVAEGGEDGVGDEAVVEDDVGAGKEIFGVGGEEAGVGGATHEGHEAGALADVDRSEGVEEIVAVGGDGEGEAALLGSGFVVEELGDAVGETESLEGACGDQDGIVVAGIELFEASADGTADGFAAGAGMEFEDFGLARGGAGADDRVVFERSTFAEDESVAGVASGEKGSENDAFGKGGGKVLGAVYDQVGPAVEQGGVEFAGEEVGGDRGVGKGGGKVAVAEGVEEGGLEASPREGAEKEGEGLLDLDAGEFAAAGKDAEVR